jgi:small subunit ribosomal protein S6
MKTPYETMFLLPPTITTEQVDELVDRLRKGIEKKSGEIIHIEKMGVRKTAYQVHKHDSAFYVMFQFRGSRETISEMERMLKNTDEVMKFLSTKITTKAAPISKKLERSEPAAAAAVTTEAPADATGEAVNGEENPAI